LNLFSNFLYIPICFAYIIPVSRWQLFGNAIPREHSVSLSKRPFVVLGALDCLATTMQIFASVYLPGPLTVLLPQATIPLSMVLSRYILHERYEWKEYAGSLAVMLGILIVLEPFWTHRYAPEYFCEALDMETDCVLCQAEVTKQACLAHTNDQMYLLPSSSDLLNHNQYTSNASSAAIPQFLLLAANATESADSAASATTTCHWLPFEDAHRGDDDALVVMWSLVMIASAIPITLSTIYKQVALGGGQRRPRLLELDPIFLNGWTAVFQFPMSVLMAFPAGLIASPPVRPLDLPRNLWDGFLCTMIGVSTIETGCHPDSMMCGSIRPSALFYVVLCLCSNVIYTLSMMLLIKYGSTVLLFLAMTMIVPLSNLAFTLLPSGGGGSGVTAMQWCDVVGLMIIIAGLVLYRFPIDSLFCMSPAANASPLAIEESSSAGAAAAADEEEERANPHPTTARKATKATGRHSIVLPASLSPSSSTSLSDLRTLEQPLLSGDV
jgi:drug/metabolite transporter (DMT)-like permease